MTRRFRGGPLEWLVWSVWGIAGMGCQELEPSDCLRTPPLSYETFGQGFLEKNCTGCHSSLLPEAQRNDAPLGVDFDSYAGVVQWADRIADRAVDASSTMPPGGGPTEEDRAMLSEWLSCQVQPDAEAVAAQGAP